ncbi:MAG TPA: ABC transporter ATP-binding protein [Thermomicrobiales bacterium]|nr:ABC transporter ATP-binding protein [Thermomicrobiales bacterium]HRA47962.1 ABC transporter ATP-binding protein [Thermomicrobiales bacterium]
MLVVKDLQVNYGAIRAVKGISFEVQERELVALIGSNGAGKSTTLKAISGIVRASGGSITYRGQDMLKMPTHRIVANGVVQSPEGRQIFGSLTVQENLLLGAAARPDRADSGVELEMVLGLFPVLQERIDQRAGTLSGGEQQMLAIGRALMAKPSLLLLDEPSLGLAPLVVNRIFMVIRQLKEQGVTILLVEQNARKALAIADRAYVLETGLITLSGTAHELSHDPAVEQAYLGGGVAL